MLDAYNMTDRIFLLTIELCGIVKLMLGSSDSIQRTMMICDQICEREREKEKEQNEFSDRHKKPQQKIKMGKRGNEKHETEL